MASERSRRGRATFDPVTAVSEATAAGSRVVEVVAGGMADTLGAPSRSRSARTGDRASRSGRRAGRGTAGEDLMDLTADVLDRIGDGFREFAGALTGHEPPASTSALALSGVAGATASVAFLFTNTGESALAGVAFAQTDLLGSADEIDAGQVSVDVPEGLEIRPGGSVRLTVRVDIPEGLAAGCYRGLLVARAPARAARSRAPVAPEDAWTLLELEVVTPDARSPIVPADS
jgi:hypothetical protein